MKEITYHQFRAEIAKEHGIDTRKKVVVATNRNYIKNAHGIPQIKAPYNSIIVDLEGKEHPYMINDNNRNNLILTGNFREVYYRAYKTIEEIEQEAGIKIRKERRAIDESNGYYSWGTLYTWKDMQCEG